MHKPISEARSLGLFRSNDGLAKELLALYPSLSWPAPRSLGTKIGEIDRGQNGWWMQRPELSKALAEHLGLAPADLGLEVHKGTKLFHFSEFPELPPLALGTEAPCSIGRIVDASNKENDLLDTWLTGYPGGLVRNPVAGISWLEVESGTGASLLSACLEAYGRFEFRRAEALEELSTRLHQPMPLVVQVNNPLSQQDQVALASTNKDTALLIIAAFPPPTSDQQIYDIYTYWELHETTGIERRKFLMTNAHELFGGLQRLHWRLKNDWQELLLNWVEARLRSHSVDTLFTAQGLRRWLQQFRAVQSALNTPRDLLGLCRLCHNMPETQLPKPDDTQAGMKLLKRLLKASTPQTKLALALIERHFNDRSQPWGQPLSLLDWAALSPDHPAFPERDELLAIAEPSSATARKQAVLALEKKLQGRRIEGLIDCGLMIETGDGQYILQPRFLVDLIARDQMIEYATEKSAKSWALLCFDPDRRAIVDAALAQLSPSQLLPIANTISELPINDPRAIGLSETLFIALGKRHGKDTPLPEAFSHIGRHVSARLSLIQPEPLSRQLSSLQQQVEWQAACWAWSLALKPSPELPHELDWLFPGWSEDLGDHDPWYLIGQPKSEKDNTTDLDSDWNRMLQVAEQWVTTITAAPLSAPPFCLPLLLREAAIGKWPIEDNWWQEVVERPWAAKHLIARLPSADEADWPALLLPSFIRFCLQSRANKENPISIIKIFMCGILQWLFSNIKEERFLACLDEAEIKFLLRFPQSLPPHLRKQLLQAPIVIKHITLDNIAAISRALDDPDTIMKLLVLIDAPKKLWELAPKKAEEILRNPQLFSLAPTELNLLARMCPAENTEAAVEYLLKQQNSDKEELLRWATQRLQENGAPIDALMNLIHQQGES